MTDAPLAPPSVVALEGALRHRVAVMPGDPFVRIGAEPWLSAAALDDRATRLAAGLRELGIGEGDRVATILPNRIEVIEVFFAIAKLGAVQVPLNYWLKGDFLRYQLEDSGARLLIADRIGLESAAPLLARTSIQTCVGVDPDLVVANQVSYQEVTHGRPDGFEAASATRSTLHSILYTSGTTGLPKGCMLSQGYYVNSGRLYGTREWIYSTDLLYTAWPLFHAAGLLNALCPVLINNASVHFEPEFHASTFMQDARAAGGTVLMGVGFMGNAILAQPPGDLDAECQFRLAVFPPMTEARQLAFEDRFKTPILSEGYGQTEYLTICVSRVSGPRKRSSLGQIAPTADVRIVDDDDEEVPDGTPGEITVRPRGHEYMYQGYWNKPEATVAAWRGLWHHTGDRGIKDADGFLTFVDRIRDRIRRRGENVSSYALELSIVEHPDIAGAAVTGVPSTIGEDDIKASVVLVPGASVDPAALFDYFRTHLPYFAIPRYVDVRAELPTNALGRIMKQVLRDEGITEPMIDFQRLGHAVTRDQRRVTAD